MNNIYIEPSLRGYRATDRDGLGLDSKVDNIMCKNHTLLYIMMYNNNKNK